MLKKQITSGNNIIISNPITKREKLFKEIVKHLFYHKELSCVEISQFVHKSIPLTTQCLNELITEGWVIENGFAESTGGRKPQMYSLKSGVFYMVAVAMDQLVTRISIISNNNNLVGDIEAFNLVLSDDSNSVQQLINHLQAFIKKSKIPASKIIGIGIGMPGFVDTHKGVNHTFLNCETGTLVNTLQAALNIPVMIDNDSSLIALAELKWGAAKKRQNVMVLNIGWGIGLGIISNGKLFRGNDGFAGEFSHIPLFDNHKICSCGKYGCLETETSLTVVAQKCIQELKEKERTSLLHDLNTQNLEDAAKKIIDAARKGDTFSIEILSGAAYNIGRGVAILIHLLNPELIVISGKGSLAGKVWMAPIQQAINEHCIPKIAEHCDIKISSLGYNAELIGAAALIMDNYEKLSSIKNESVTKNIKIIENN